MAENQINYLANRMRAVNQMYINYYQLSQLDFRNNENVETALNYVRDNAMDKLEDVSSPGELKNLIKKMTNEYAELYRNLENQYDNLYQQTYFHFPVHNVGFGKSNAKRYKKKR